MKRSWPVLLLPAIAAIGAGGGELTAERAWGELGHRIIGQLAVEGLPKEMPAFFRDAQSQLVYLNPEPDRWRDGAERRLDPAMDGLHSPEHYIDLELIPGSRRAGMLAAPTRVAFADSLRLVGAQPSAVGVLPFSILELTQLLRSNFRRWRTAPDSATRTWIEQRIVNDAGVLGHYVADASNPAHTTIHHNGWVGENPRGFATDNRFHGRFEGAFVQAKIGIGDVRPLIAAPARLVGDLRTSAIAHIEQSHAHLDALYVLDKEMPFGDQNDGPRHKRFAAERLAAGATMLRDLWWTAWVTSASEVKP